MAETPRDALVRYIEELETKYYPWYARAAGRDFYGWVGLQAVSTIAGFATSLLVALHQGNVIQGDWLKPILIILPFTGSTVSTLLVQSRIRDLAALREQGRERVQYLTSRARSDVAAAASDADVVSIHRGLVAAVHDLESRQSRSFHSLLAQSEQTRSANKHDAEDA